jgi:hypothetical protein
MSAYARRLAAYERSRDILAARLWTMDAALPRTREAIFLAHNWIGCRVEHPAHGALIAGPCSAMRRIARSPSKWNALADACSRPHARSATVAGLATLPGRHGTRTHRNPCPTTKQAG